MVMVADEGEHVDWSRLTRRAPESASKNPKSLDYRSRATRWSGALCIVSERCAFSSHGTSDFVLRAGTWSRGGHGSGDWSL